MSDSLLSRMALSVVPVWGAQRALSALLLQVQALDAQPLDGAHLHALLREVWVQRGPPLLLRLDHPQTLWTWLQAGRAHGAAPAMAVVEDAWLDDEALLQATGAALQGGLPLLWRGGFSRLPSLAAPLLADMLPLVRLGLEPTLALLAAARSAPGAPCAPGAARAPSVRGLLCEQPACAQLGAYCLDRAGAAGVAGWPVEDAALNNAQPGVPSRRVIVSLMDDIERDLSLERLEQGISRDAVLAWRFLRFANSASFGRGDFGSIRHALMLVGVTPLRQWLTEQLPRAVDDPDLRPLQETAVLTAQLMQAMVDAGSEQQLLRELYLCGLFSDIDLLCGEPLADVLRHLPLPGRVRDAIVLQRGAYAHYLRIVRAQLGRDAAGVAQACAEAEVSLEDANRTLLLILGRLRPERPLRLPVAATAA